MANKNKGKELSPEHKEALAQGRDEARTVRAYLEALKAHRPKRGRKRTEESIRKRLDVIERDLPTADPLREVQLVQERMDLEAELASNKAGSELPELEAEFVKVARSYSQRKGISYMAWRQTGVPANVLRAAGISRAASG